MSQLRSFLDELDDEFAAMPPLRLGPSAQTVDRRERPALENPRESDLRVLATTTIPSDQQPVRIRVNVTFITGTVGGDAVGWLRSLLGGTVGSAREILPVHSSFGATQ